MIALIERLATYATSGEGPGIPAELRLFDIFSEQASAIVASRQDMLAEDVVALQTALVNLALKCYADRTDYADTVFETTRNVFEKLCLDRWVS